VVTRVRRGDVEFLPHGDTVLELGDRIRVLTQREHLDAVSSFFGDSYRAVSEIDILSFSVGLALGLIVGMIPIPLPGGSTLRLGFAGGPLIVALILGNVERSGPIVWTLPYNANLTLRQFGLVLFLAGVGTRSAGVCHDVFTSGRSLNFYRGRHCDVRYGVPHVVHRLQVAEDSDEHHDGDSIRPTDAARGFRLCAGTGSQ
jgi:putative transport protein